METIVEMVGWFADAANWQGPTGVPTRVLEHLRLSVVPIAAAAAIAIPAGVLSGHFRRFQSLGAAVANAGRAMPTLALLVFGIIISFRWLDIGFQYWPTVLALFFLALHPLFTNAYTAVRDTDAATIDAARGMGLSEARIIWEVELPIASPVVLTAVRITAVQVVATAPIGALAGGVGLGRFIIDGYNQFDYGEMLAGVVLVAAVALLVEQLLNRLERVLIPQGLQRADVEAVAAMGRAA